MCSGCGSYVCGETFACGMILILSHSWQQHELREITSEFQGCPTSFDASSKLRPKRLLVDHISDCMPESRDILGFSNVSSEIVKHSSEQVNLVSIVLTTADNCIKRCHRQRLQVLSDVRRSSLRLCPTTSVPNEYFLIRSGSALSNCFSTYSTLLLTHFKVHVSYCEIPFKCHLFMPCLG